MTFWKSMSRKLRLFWRLPARDSSLLVYSAICLPIVRIALNVFGFRRCAAWVSGLACPSNLSIADHSAWIEARSVTRMVEFAGRNNGFSRNCLRSSLLLAYILRSRGIPAELRIGVRPDDVTLDAHAWVEWDGQVLNDHAEVAKKYAPFSGLTDAVRLP